MDGPTIVATVVTSSVVIGGAIMGGFWRVWVKIGDQNKSIGSLEGKMDGIGKQVGSLDTRIDRLDGRLNGFVDVLIKEGKLTEKGKLIEKDSD